jgi:RHS repeat-associated protein
VGRVTTHRDGEGRTTFYEYDPATGDIVFAKDALLNTTIFTYEPDGRVRTVTTPDGATTAISYVVAGPAVVTETVASGRTRTSSITYTTLGQPETVTDPRGQVMTFRYFPTGDLESVTDPLGQFDPIGHTTKFEYDAAGRRTLMRNPLDQIVSTEYDGGGRVRLVRQPDGSTTEFKYDLGGRRIAVVDPLGRETRSGYDPFSRLQSVVDPLGGITAQEYDLMSRPTSLRDPEGRMTGFEYDGHGRLLKTIWPGDGVEALTYDSSGRLTQRVDRKGTITTYAYDAMGRLLKTAYSDGTPALTLAYDVMGRLTSAANATDTVTRTYDLLGRVLTETSAKNASTVAYTYDDAGNRLTVALNGQPQLSFTYDDASRPVTVGASDKTFVLTYDGAAKRRSLRYPNGVVTGYDYDDDSRLLKVEAKKDGTIVAQSAYTYDAAGNRKTKAVPGTTESYSYDKLGRLTEVGRSESGQSWSYQYDRVGNRLAEQTPVSILRSTYDERNHLLAQDAGGLVPVDVQLSEPGTVRVNGQAATARADNRHEASVTTVPGTNTLLIEARDASGNVATKNFQLSVSATPASFEYDANGNLVKKIEDGHADTYEWDAENRLMRVVRDGQEVSRFAYDPLERRVERIAAGITTKYLYDGENILGETRTDSTGIQVFTYVHGPGVDEPLARRNASGALVYYHADGLGSVVNMTEESGSVVQSRRYDAWGNIEIGSSEPGYAFTGREWDPESGLYYYRARYYDPRIGRFISDDPIGFAGGINLYAYVDGNPTSEIDPLGLAGIVISGIDRMLVSQLGPAPPVGTPERARWDLSAKLTLMSGLPTPMAIEAPLASQLHHIATNKSIVSGVTAAFENIFAKAGMTLNAPENLLELAGHAGRHSAKYHQYVLDRLLNAVRGLQGAEYTAALKFVLNDLKQELLNNPELIKGCLRR